MILSAYTSNGGPHIARPEPLSTRRMLKLLRKRLDLVSIGKLPKKKGGVRKVHRLRVATRKAIAALAVCRPLLSKSDSRDIEKALDAQRKALGEVRDWDVLISRVLCAPADEKADLRCDLLLYLAGERDRAWRGARKDWSKATADVDWSVAKKAKPGKRAGAGVTAHELFRRALGEPLATIRHGIPHSSGDPLDMEALHEFRIACKSLRYLLEYRDDVTVSPSTSQASSSALELLTEAQQRLGDLHDWSRRPELLRSGRRADSKGVRKWLQTTAEQGDRRLAEEVQRYHTWQSGVDFEGAFRGLDGMN